MYHYSAEKLQTIIFIINENKFIDLFCMTMTSAIFLIIWWNNIHFIQNKTQIPSWFNLVRHSVEYFSSKIETVISTLNCSIIEDVRFDYLLIDSLFTCSELLKFVELCFLGYHLIVKIKIGKTKYEIYSANKKTVELIKVLLKRKRVKYSCSIGLMLAYPFTEKARKPTWITCLFLIGTWCKRSLQNLLKKMGYRIYSQRDEAKLDTR